MGSPGAALRMHWTEPRGGRPRRGLGSGHAAPSFLVLLAAAPSALGPGRRPPHRPRGTGPNGDWARASLRRASARTGENLTWRVALPETGRDHGPAVASTWRRCPLGSCERPRRRSARFHDRKRTVVGSIDAHCLDRATGELLWTRRIEGSVPAIYTYPFSDATSASPVADEAHVWFTNAAGRVVCFTRDGETEWSHDWIPAFDGPFNKQFEPFLVQDGERRVLVQMLPGPAPGAEDPEDLHGRWHRLVGLDADTGEELWQSADALTQYNAPTLARVAAGEGGTVVPCALIGRGGPHAVPERPVGVSLVRLTGENAGATVWRYEDPRGNHEAALQTMAHDGAHASILGPRSALVLDPPRRGQRRSP